jgi:hypothetical protein
MHHVSPSPTGKAKPSRAIQWGYGALTLSNTVERRKYGIKNA